MPEENREEPNVIGRNYAVRPDQISFLNYIAAEAERSASYMLRQIIDHSPEWAAYRALLAARRPEEMPA